MTTVAGTAAPDFTLLTDTGEALTLSSLRGRPVVLYFYPKLCEGVFMSRVQLFASAPVAQRLTGRESQLEDATGRSTR